MLRLFHLCIIARVGLTSSAIIVHVFHPKCSRSCGSSIHVVYIMLRLLTSSAIILFMSSIPNAAGPVVHSPSFSLLTNLATHPSHFTITCPSSSTPPLSTVWSRDSTPLMLGGGQFEASRVLVNASASHYDNVLSVSGDLVGEYKCVVSNDNGSNEASFTVRGQSLK